jgi:hypothetical protein
MTQETEMTAPDLRDQMAMAALTGLLAAEDFGAGQNYYTTEQAANRAYAIADAMLAERNRTTKGEDHV